MGREQRPRIGAVFAIQELSVKQDAEARRAYHSYAVRLDMATNSWGESRNQRTPDRG